MTDWQHAHVDESTALDAQGRRLYVVAATVSSEAVAPALKGRLREALLPGQDHLHWAADRSLARRLELAGVIAECEIAGAVLVTRLTSNRQQEQARKKVLAALLPWLQWRESTTQVVIESRHQGDAHDVRTVGWLRQSRVITAQMRIEHVPKREDERLWIADAVVSAYVAARCHGQTEPWDRIAANHAIDIQNL